MKKNLLPDLRVQIAGLKLKNPVLAASGTFGYGTEYSPLVRPEQFGAVITKTVTLDPRSGNRPPRLCETASGMLNSIGLANVGIERFITDKLPALQKAGATVIANIAGNGIEEYARLARRLDREPAVAGLELNISCPNVKQGGIAFGTDPAVAAELTRAVRRVWGRTLIVKLSPNVSDITVIARAAEAAGADALSMINTLFGMAVDIRRQRPVLGNTTGGLSGPAIKPVALYHLHRAYRAVKIPLIGLGGIMNGEDAVEFMLAGAAAVQIGTANFCDPSAAAGTIRGLSDYCRKNGLKKVSQLSGMLKCRE
jgi:dihydroorotate dehydrogenase (NAD+) catalytic subunit